MDGRGPVRTAPAESVIRAVSGHHEVFHACTVVAATRHRLATYPALFA